MIARRADELARALGGRIVAGEPGLVAEGVSIDSRTIGGHDAFFAILGERFDGHDFAKDAATRGAGIVVADRELALPDDAVLILVEDTTKALGDLARDERRRRGLEVLGVTGSSGKTTTRALASVALGSARRTASSAGSLNNQWGLPLSILRLPADAEVAVLEMGMNHAGEIAALAAIAEPQAGVITNVGTAHIGLLGSVEAIADAKCELLDALPPEGVGVVHKGSPELMHRAERSKVPLLTFGRRGEGADLEGRLIDTDIVGGTRFELRGIEVSLALWGEHAMLNALAALGACEALGVPLEGAAEALSRVEAIEGRGRVLRLGRDVILIDECYNANPSAMETVLKAMSESSHGTGRVAVLGDMKELGDQSSRFHRELGVLVARLGIDRLVAVGEHARELADAARDAGLDAVQTFDDAAGAADALPDMLQGAELVLVKGSRSVGLEAVRDALRDALGEEVRA